MSKKRFMITGIEKGCYRIGNVKDIRKDTGLLGSVKLSELTGESCILDMLNQLNNENEQLRKELKRCKDWINSDKNGYELTLAFIKNKGYSLKDVLEYEKELFGDG